MPPEPQAALPVGMTDLPSRVADTATLLAAHGYIADLELAMTVHLARPCAGRCSWGRAVHGRPRSPRCWRPASTAAWCAAMLRRHGFGGRRPGRGTIPRQLMAIRLARPPARPTVTSWRATSTPAKFLQARPLLSAIDPDLPPAVLLIDELDRADEPFEAFLLELLADFQDHRCRNWAPCGRRPCRWWC